MNPHTIRLCATVMIASALFAPSAAKAAACTASVTNINAEQTRAQFTTLWQINNNAGGAAPAAVAFNYHIVVRSTDSASGIPAGELQVVRFKTRTPVQGGSGIRYTEVQDNAFPATVMVSVDVDSVDCLGIAAEPKPIPRARTSRR